MHDLRLVYLGGCDKIVNLADAAIEADVPGGDFCAKEEELHGYLCCTTIKELAMVTKLYLTIAPALSRFVQAAKRADQPIAVEDTDDVVEVFENKSDRLRIMDSERQWLMESYDRAVAELKAQQEKNHGN